MKLTDLKIEYEYPKRDKGGQHVGVPRPDIRVTHVPTGLVAVCRNELSQTMARKVAMAMIEYGLAEMGWEDGCEVKIGARDWMRAKHDLRPGRGLWEPGEYLCACYQCKNPFIGDKRARTCAPCAYGDSTLNPAPSTVTTAPQ